MRLVYRRHFAQRISFYFRWFCHFDDDNYVNVEALVRTLENFDPEKDWYLGKTSIKDPIEVLDRTAATFSKDSVSFSSGDEI